MTVTVRQAGPDDAALLHRIAAVTFPLACPPDTTAEAIRQFIHANLGESHFAAHLADPAREVLVSAVDGVPAGYTMVAHGDPTDADVGAVITVRPAAELSKCYVLADFHGAGVAAAQVAEAVRGARARGAAVLWLGVNQHNARANRFYEKNGFVRVGTKHFLVGDRFEDDFVRALHLTEHATSEQAIP